MASVAERIEEARRRWCDATDAETRAREDLARLEIEAATARAEGKLAEAIAQGSLSPELHGELVANAAREHGATCARASRISDVSWRGVRVALASLVERVKTAEKQRAEAELAVEQALGGGMESLETQLAEAEEALGRAWLSGDVSLAEGIRRKTARLSGERDRHAARCRDVTRAIINQLGSVGPESLEAAVVRLIAAFRRAERAEVDLDGLREQYEASVVASMEYARGLSAVSGQLALAMAWGQELVGRLGDAEDRAAIAEGERDEARHLRDEATKRTDEARRALSISATKSAGADVMVADAESRRVAAELRAIDAESRAERAERENARLEKATRDALAVAIGRASPDTMEAAVREAEERGARWAYEADAEDLARWGRTAPAFISDETRRIRAHAVCRAKRMESAKAEKEDGG